MKMERVAVTGANGLLGKVVVERLSRDYEITTIARETLADSTLAREVAASVDAIIHCAGKITVAAELEQNVVMAAALATAAGQTPILNFSSCAVYGHPAAKIIDETTPCRPVLDYGKSKLRAELEFGAANVCHMRIGNVFTEAIFSSVLNSPLKRLLRGGEYSNLISGLEVAEIVAHLLSLPSRPRVLNVTRDDLGPLTYSEVYAMRSGHSGPALPSICAHLARRARGQQSTAANRRFSNTALLATGYRPMTLNAMLGATHAAS